jgi:glycosyltransferase involved in cell wall biosynthesis
MESKKILFVAMQNSAHTVRWINQISSGDWDIHLFPINDIPVHPDLRNVTIHQPWFVLRRSMLQDILRHPHLAVKGWSGLKRMLPQDTSPVETIHPFPVLPRFNPYTYLAKPVSQSEAGVSVAADRGPETLVKLILKLKPDLIHSLEFQHCGYNVLRAKELMGDGFPLWLATNWGSDIYYYRQFDNHRSQITRLLRNADYYSCECHRDVGLAKELGFAGTIMPVMPNGGGFDLKVAGHWRNIRPASRRKLILVKGYQSFAGRALTALDAIEMCAEELRGFKIIVYSASPSVRARVHELQLSTELDMAVLEHVVHDTMLRMFARARVYLGVSVSDGISTSMLEAMAMGAFPIQTNTSCCNEWIKDGESGFEIPAEDVTVIADRLRAAATDDGLVDRAAEINWNTVQQQLDQSSLQQKALGFYKEIFA